ncbi:hypothetical protein TREMEDRAFT_39462 [Tremella mesenterica DSM 1558]|uniref:uncharacterized protein n=1 Tax=Tremella mesenterica (strain ATCC 24925 / CBS 8224 / DSM 1558 / NBRC 9311 / NRRL Y-6157 / RJB 2259-6 / UBC 559-6) TaxID=578456 RepID=UPI0003F49C0F|nr:uncharacterized protein TREMEDRAFT_39462 [Tremella mesenterica DSM 1558]EIW69231.1 hypothetical protein TREMEDRAFT_39462 [Tremella mesenterica DSM 1558]
MTTLAKSIPRTVKEIRLHLCQTSPASQGVRQFILSSYSGIKASNPDLKFLIREAAGVEPKAFVRWERGVESSTGLSGLNEKDVASALNQLVNQQTVGKA